VCALARNDHFFESLKNTTGKGLWYFTVFNYFQGKLIMPMM